MCTVCSWSAAQLMLVMGFATDRDGWLRLLQCLLASSASAGLQICTFDNRGAPPCTWWSCVRVTCCSLVCAQVSVCRASPRSASRRPTWRAFVPCTPTSTLFSLVALVSLTLSLPCFSLISSASGCVLSHCFASLSSSARFRLCSVAVFLVLCRCHCCPRCRRLACPALLLTHCRCLLRTPSISQSTLAGRTSILLGAHAHCLCASDYSDRDLSLGDCLGLLPMRSPFSMTARSLCSHAAEYSVQHLHGRNDLPGDCARCSAWVHSVAHAGASMGRLVCSRAARRPRLSRVLCAPTLTFVCCFPCSHSWRRLPEGLMVSFRASLRPWACIACSLASGSPCLRIACEA